MKPNQLPMYFRITFLLSALLYTAGLPAQSAATVKAYTDKSRILIGERLQLTVEIMIPEQEAIRFVTLDSIPHFEWLEKPVTDTVNTGGGTLLKGVYVLTSFDSGHWVIPAFELSGGLKTDTIPVDVVFSDFNPEQPYHDIKDILEDDPVQTKARWWWYVAGGIVLLLLLLLYLRLRRKKPVGPLPAVIAIHPFEEAMKALQVVAETAPVSKVFHTRLAEIFRLYVFRKRKLLSLQKTTDDLVLQLSGAGLEKSVYEAMAQALRTGDFVKFAKYEASPADNQAALAAIKKSIEALEQLN
ncbi:MAG: hypothetical protein J0M10_08565 [Chitinophagales bacterium]|nr:hypothetical protein [Chitinophagales bacterium]